MDNISDDNLKRLAKFIAEELINLGKETNREDWMETNIRDNIVGELARCVTLQNLYLDREEFEKCAVMKLKIEDLTKRLNIKDDFLKDLEDNEE